MSLFLQDLRYALRHFARHPGFTAVAVITLALGLGVNVHIYAFVKGLVFQPVPGVERAGEIQVLTTVQPQGRVSPLSYPDFRDYREETKTFESLAASAPVPMTLAGDGARNERVWGELVSGNYFEALGLRAQRGRLLSREDERRTGGPAVVVISDHLWRERFDGDPTVVGRTLRLHGRPFTVVGVAPPGFRGSLTGMGLDLFVPLGRQPEVYPVGDLLESRNRHWLQAKGRLASGVSRAAAEAEMQALASTWATRYPETNQGKSARLYDISASPLSGAAILLPMAAILFALTFQVLLVTGANVTNLFQARLLGRRRELAVRLSQGATRVRLIRQILTESAALSLIGGGVGLLIGLWAKDLIDRQPIPTPLPTHFDAQADARVMGFTLAAALGLGLLLGLLPALRASRPSLLAALRGETGGLEGRRRPGSLLVVTQVAFSVVPLICAGLFLRSFHNAVHLDPGFRTENVLLGTVERPAGEEGWQIYQRVREAAARLPGVEAVALARAVPLSLRGSPQRTVVPVGYEPEPDEDAVVGYNLVSEGYFRTLDLPLRAGRGFRAGDDDDQPRVAVVNEALARRYWPRGEALGKRLALGGSEGTEIVGVVADSQVERLGERPPPYLYLPYRQHPPREMTLHLISSRTPAGLFDELAAAVEKVHPELALFDALPMERHLEASRLILRGLATALAVGGLLSVLLAAAGLYGVMLQAVSRRTHEIGVRMALGAHRSDALRLILRRGLGLTAVGLALGVLLALGVTHLLRFLLLEVSPSDPLSFVAATGLLAAIAGLAAFLPARRAARIQPVQALRVE